MHNNYVDDRELWPQMVAQRMWFALISARTRLHGANPPALGVIIKVVFGIVYIVKEELYSKYLKNEFSLELYQRKWICCPQTERLLSFLLNDLSDTESLEACTWSRILPPLGGCLLSSLWWCFPHHTTHAGIYCDLEDTKVGTSSESSVPRTNEILPFWAWSKHVEITVDTVQWIIERTGKDPYVQWENSLNSI